MDGQDHRALRAIAADWFRPKAMRALRARVDELARRHVDHMLLSLLGLPEDDYSLIQQLTNELFGMDDPEHRRGTASEDLVDVVADIFEYFGKAAIAGGLLALTNIRPSTKDCARTRR